MKKYFLCTCLCIFFVQVSNALPIYKGFPALVPTFVINLDLLSANGTSKIDSFSLDIDNKQSLRKANTFRFKNIISYRRTLKKLKRQISEPDVELSPADKKAQTSLIFGIVALVLAIIPFYTIVLAIPFGIIAIAMGNKAKKMGTKKKTGIGFAIAALILVALWGVALASFVALY